MLATPLAQTAGYVSSHTIAQAPYKRRGLLKSVLSLSAHGASDTRRASVVISLDGAFFARHGNAPRYSALGVLEPAL